MKGVSLATSGIKNCSDCGEDKPITEFLIHPNTADGHRKFCKECGSKREKARYRGLNPNQIAELDRVQQFTRGLVPITELDDDEVRGSFIRDSYGKPVYSKDLDKRFQSKFTAELSRRLNCYLRSKAPDVLTIIFNIASSDLVEPADRLKAATWLAERVIGKTPETLLIGKAEQPYEAIFEQLDGGSRDEFRASKAIEDGSNVIVEAEVVDVEGESESELESESEDSNPLVDAQDEINAKKEALARIRKAKQRRYAARAMGAGLDQVPWFVKIELIEDEHVLLDLVLDGYQGDCAYRAKVVSPSELTQGQFDRMNAARNGSRL